LAALATAAFFVLGISAWHISRGRELLVYVKSATIALIAGAIASVGVAFTGHMQAQVMTDQQPMKMAAAEALYDTQTGAEFSLFAIGDLSGGEPAFNITVPKVLSILAENDPNATVLGINELQARSEAVYGPGSYVPIVWVAYWSFRVMTGAGFAMIALALFGLWLLRRHTLERSRRFLWLLLPALFLPYIANTAGWIFTEMGRQPWIVYGLELTKNAASPTVSAAMVGVTVVGFTVIYGGLMAVDVWLMARFAKQGPPEVDPAAIPAHAY
jgi:cytochrome d ubiquinol oxidase subunit I